MEIQYGEEGIPAAVLNTVTGSLYPLDGHTAPKGATAVSAIRGNTAQMFAFLGGEQLTKQGSKGTGRLPDGTDLAQCGVLRVDGKHPRLPLRTLVGPEGIRCIVTAYSWQIRNDALIVFVRTSEEHGTEVFLAKNRPTAVRKVLDPTTARTMSSKDFTLKSYGKFGPEGEMSARSLTFKLYGRAPTRIGCLTLRRILELVLWDDLYSPGSFRRHKVTDWERGLGLARAIDGEYYFNVGGILREKFLPPKDWQEAFGWVTFVGDPRHGYADGSLYLTQRKEGRYLVASYPLRMKGNKPEYVVKISGQMADTITRTGELTPTLVNELLPPPPPTEKK